MTSLERYDAEKEAREPIESGLKSLVERYGMEKLKTVFDTMYATEAANHTPTPEGEEITVKACIESIGDESLASWSVSCRIKDGNVLEFLEDPRNEEIYSDSNWVREQLAPLTDAGVEVQITDRRTEPGEDGETVPGSYSIPRASLNQAIIDGRIHPVARFEDGDYYVYFE